FSLSFPTSSKRPSISLDQSFRSTDASFDTVDLISPKSVSPGALGIPPSNTEEPGAPRTLEEALEGAAEEGLPELPLDPKNGSAPLKPEPVPGMPPDAGLLEPVPPKPEPPEVTEEPEPVPPIAPPPICPTLPNPPD